MLRREVRWLNGRHWTTPETMRHDAVSEVMVPEGHPRRTGFECASPILNVADMARSVRYYVDVLGFSPAPWGSDDFTSVNRDAAGIYLCKGGQGVPGTWVWVGVDDVQALFEEYNGRGAMIRHPPRNYPWAYEMKVEDPDGHVLRFGSEPRADLPFVEWSD